MRAQLATYEEGTMTAETTTEPAPKKKRKKGISPTQRALAECRKRGWIAQVVERWNPHAHIRQDLFGVIDIVAIVPPDTDGEHGYNVPGFILGIQACSGSGGDHAARRAKIAAEPRATEWKRAGGKLAVWSFAQRGAAGTRKQWTLREEYA